jgi:hypothetical protein
MGDSKNSVESELLNTSLVPLVPKDSLQGSLFEPEPLKVDYPEQKPCGFAVGDRVTGTCIRTKQEITGAVTGIGNKYLQLEDGAITIESARLEALPPESSSLAPGDRVSFTQPWYGELHKFEGTVQEVTKTTALVDYETPPELDDGIDRLTQLQAPIGHFTPQHEAPNEADLLREQIAALRKGGVVAPDGGWIERKVHASGWTEAVYKARNAIFTGKRGGLAKSQYIGKWGSPAHTQAMDAVDRRNQVMKLEKQLRKIEHDDDA